MFCNTTNNYVTDLQNPKIKKISDVGVAQERLINYANLKNLLFSTRRLATLCCFGTKSHIESSKDISEDHKSTGFSF